MRLGLGRRLRDLPLFWKVLLPFLVLLVLLGTVGSFLLVRGLTDRADRELNSALTERSFSARSTIQDRELYVLEAASFAANLQGVADATTRRDIPALQSLLRSVLALKTDLSLLAVFDSEGNGLVQFSRSDPNAAPVVEAPSTWASTDLVAPVRGGGTETSAALLGQGDQATLSLATAICAGNDQCVSVGGVVAGISSARIIAETPGAPDAGGVALYGDDKRLISASDRAPAAAEELPESGFVRLNRSIDDEKVVVLFSPVELQGKRVGSLGVWTPERAAFAGVRSAALRLGLLVLAAMLGVVAIGAGLSRFLLAQLRPLVAANRALGEGDLSARVPVLGRDELGEVAAGVNQMAAALEASYELLESRVQERTAEVERLLRERTDFFTAVSHELRTPLAVILGQAEMMRDPLFEKEARWHQETGAVLQDAAKQLLDFVNDIVEIARAESGRIELDVVEVRVGSLLTGLRPTIDGLAAAAELDSDVCVPRRLPPVRADEARLRQVVLDLVDNAVKYTPAGGKVQVRARATAAAVEISVADNGVGIPAEDRERLFEPFYRVKSTTTQRDQPSSGLGLALVKGLVQAQGGDVRFESEVGRGTTFTVSMPR